jgi:hypothetical protein
MSSGEFDLRSRLRGFLVTDDASPQCSRAQCSSPAEHRIEWRNPRIHDADRVKIWLACGEHYEFLLGFLESRQFPLRIARIGDPVNEEPIE